MLHYQMGLLLEQKADFKKAKHNLIKKALRCSRALLQMLSRLAMLHIKEKNYSNAITQMSGPMLELHPG